jgi:hypothetical protein
LKIKSQIFENKQMASDLAKQKNIKRTIAQVINKDRYIVQKMDNKNEERNFN